MKEDRAKSADLGDTFAKPACELLCHFGYTIALSIKTAGVLTTWIPLCARKIRFSTTSLLDLLLVEDTRNLWHPLLPPLAPELALRWQISRMIKCPRHNISEVLNRSSPDLQDTASTCWAKFSMQHCAAAIVGLMDRGLLRFGGVGEGRDRHFRCEPEGCTEEFLEVDQRSGPLILPVENAAKGLRMEGNPRHTLQFLQWHRDVRASSGDTSTVYLISPQ